MSTFIMGIFAGIGLMLFFNALDSGNAGDIFFSLIMTVVCGRIGLAIIREQRKEGKSD